MKSKILSIGLILILIVVLIVITGCGNSNEETASETTNSNNVTEESTDTNNVTEENTDTNGITEENEEVNNASVSTDRLEEIEVETFNAQFESYEGDIIGASVRAMLATLINNAETNGYAEEYIPTVEIIDENSNETTILVEEDVDSYIEEVTRVRTKIVNSHFYTVEFNYAESGLIDEIIINY